VLNHCLKRISSFNTHLSNSRPWFNAHYWPARRRRRRPSCNVISTQVRESCQTAASTTDDRLISGAMFYTGSTSLTGSGSGCASRCTSVSTAWLPDTWSTSDDLSPASTATNVSDLQILVNCRFRGSGCQPTEAVLWTCRTIYLERSSEHS